MTIDPSQVSVVTWHLREDIVGWAEVQPGAVSGQWLLSPEKADGFGIVVFSSQDSAMAATQGPRALPHDDSRAWNVVDVTVYEQVASALSKADAGVTKDGQLVVKRGEWKSEPFGED